MSAGAREADLPGRSRSLPAAAAPARRIVEDVSDLPTFGFGPRSPIWWGTLAFISLEGTGFALAVGAYLYLVFVNPDWPLSVPPPGLLWSSLFTAVLLLSAWPNLLAKRDGEAFDLGRSRRDLVIMSLVGIVLVGLRGMEFTTLYVKWDTNAYGSILWLLLVLHTVHLVTDLADTLVLAVLMFTRHARGKRFSDVSDNAFYWYFVVASWLPIYLLLYWFPRW